MLEKISVFISSTSDLKDERQALKEATTNLCGLIEPFLYEDVEANSASPEDFCREMIKKSEIYIGILGGKYGSLYPPEYAGSIVEFEFKEASARKGLYLTAIFSKVLPPEEIESTQQAFRDRVENFGDGVWRRNYDSLDKLKNEVRNSITRWLAEALIKYKKAEEPIVVRQSNRIKGLAGTIAGIAAIIALLSTLLTLGATAQAVAIAIGCLAVGILLCIIVAHFLL